jgi:GNAT superfamily N-acetyltransferase
VSSSDRAFPAGPGLASDSAEERALLGVLMRVSEICCVLPEMQRLLIRPCCVSAGSGLWSDVQIEIAPAETSTRRYGHMAIHPYPEEMLRRWQLPDGRNVVIRPIRPEDAERERAFVENLSAESRYNRFMYRMDRLTPKMLARFTQIDYDREMALAVVLEERGDETRLLAVARYVTNPDGESCEFALTVADDVQRQGIGRQLMQSLMNAARDRGLEVMEGDVSPRTARCCVSARALVSASSGTRKTRRSWPCAVTSESRRQKPSAFPVLPCDANAKKAIVTASGSQRGGVAGRRQRQVSGGSAVESQVRDGKVDGARRTNRDQPDSPQALKVQGLLRAIGAEVAERYPVVVPAARAIQRRAVALPGAREIGAAQVYAEAPAVAQQRERQPGIRRCVDRAPVGVEIQGQLQEAAVVAQADLALQAPRGASVDRSMGHCTVGDAPHDAITQEAPARSVAGARRCAAVVDQCIDHR